MICHSDKGLAGGQGSPLGVPCGDSIVYWLGQKALSHTLFPLNQDVVVMTQQRGAWSGYLGDCVPD